MSGWLSIPPGLPFPPRNGNVFSPYIPGAWDLRWDDPGSRCENQRFSVVGVNVYRSDGNDRGPYRRINSYPVGGNFYRDQTQNVLVEEVVHWETGWHSKGQTGSNGAWVIRTQYQPVKKDGIAVPADSPYDVMVFVNQTAIPVQGVSAGKQWVYLVTSSSFEPGEERIHAPFNIGPQDEVVVRYFRNQNKVEQTLNRNTFYRLTTVVMDPQGGHGLVETPIQFCPPLNPRAVENLDYIWKEAIRRNNWILEQGGERVRAFTRKRYGIPCPCTFREHAVEFKMQPDSQCKTCFGTGLVGGYEGPFDLIIGPNDSEHRIAQQEQGRRLEHSYEVWTNPYPYLTQRDFIVNQENERYSVGPVNRPSNRGNYLMQMFTIANLPHNHIVYQVPVEGTSTLPWPQTRYTDKIITGDPCQFRHNFEGQPIPTGPDVPGQTPMATNKENIPQERQDRGRTPAWENQNY